MAGKATAAPPVELEMRRMKFEMGAGVPRHWARGSKFLTHWFNAMSVVFPDGEKFFIEAVRHFEDRVEDPQLRRAVRAFVAQEGHHGFQHRLMNEVVKSHGIDLQSQERWIRNFLQGLRERTSAEERLGITCALEHYTAQISHQILAHPEDLEGFEPRMLPLWRWHAVEETEHKAVAYDVYQAVVKSYARRFRTQFLATFLFIPILHLIQFRLMRDDDTPTRWSDVLRGFAYLWGKPGQLRRMLPAYLRYYRRDFHPWQHDNRELIALWKRSDEARYRVASELAL